MKEATRIQIEAMKAQTFGCEVEMNNISRRDAAKLAAEYFGTDAWKDTNAVNGYSTWSAWDEQCREWKFSRDCSIAGPNEERCELVTPVLRYEDMELLQGLIRALRKAGAKSCPSRGCGVHIHIGANGHTPQTLRNLANLMASHEKHIAKAIEIPMTRMNHYCRMVDRTFLERLNTEKPGTMEELADCWYEGNGARYGRTEHYNDSRYHMVNLHAFFNRYHTIEFRCFQFDEPGMVDKDGNVRKGGLHAGQLKAMIQLCLAMSQMAKQSRTISAKPQQTENEAYAFRCWMLRLGFIGEEFKTAREYFMRNFEGNAAWRHAA